MSQSPFLNALGAILEHPDETCLARFKADVWPTELWMVGRSRTHPDGQVAMSFNASVLEGADRPVLFAYLDEAQARAHHPQAQFIAYPLGVVGLLAQQQALDLAIVDGDAHRVMSHEQFLALRDLMLVEKPQPARDTHADDRFLERFEPFLIQARDYCERVPDVGRLHLTALALGRAPMSAAGLLTATNREVHVDALREMFGAHMEPGDRIHFLDARERPAPELIEAVSEAAPVYVREDVQGWWARLFHRDRRPQLAVVALEMAPDEA